MHRCNKLPRIIPKYVNQVRYSHSVDYDVIIAGGGMVGAALAVSLLRAFRDDIKVAILEKTIPKSLEECQDKTHPDIRVYALSPNSISFLKDINVWASIEKRSQPYTTMQVWESEGDGMLRFNSSSIPAEELGRIVEDITIQAALYDVIKQNSSKISNMYGYSIVDVNFPVVTESLQLASAVSDPVKVIVSNSLNETSELTTRLLVGADGAQSFVRKLANISTITKGYGQEAIVATVKYGGDTVKYGGDTSNAEKKRSENVGVVAAVVDVSLQDESIPLTETKRSEDGESVGDTSTSSTIPPSTIPPSNPNYNVSEQNYHHNPSSGGSMATAYQKYLPTGPLAVLPLWDRHASIVWTTSPTEVKRLKALSKEQFLNELNTAMSVSQILQNKEVPLNDNTTYGGSATSDGNGYHDYDGTLVSFIRSAPLPSPVQHVLEIGVKKTSFARKNLPFPPGIGVVAKIQNSMTKFKKLAIASDPATTPPTMTQVISPLISFPLQISNATSYCQHRLVLIGDAGHSIHPHAGQGLNLGINEVVNLTKILRSYHETGHDIGSTAVLKQYDSASNIHNVPILLGVDLLLQLFAHQSVLQEYGLHGGINRLRAIGMLTVHNFDFLKKKIASIAMGIQK